MVCLGTVSILTYLYSDSGNEKDNLGAAFTRPELGDILTFCLLESGTEMISSSSTKRIFSLVGTITLALLPLLLAETGASGCGEQLFSSSSFS